MSTNIDYWEKIIKNPTESYKRLFEEQKKYLTEHIKKNSSVLDIGCGDGKNIETILLVTDSITGIDNDQKAVDHAKKNLLSKPSVKILLGNALALPFPNNSFDFIVFFDILENLERHKVAALIEASRVLKKDGEIFLGSYSEDAFDERIKIYKRDNIPIAKIDGTKVVFDKSVGANESEQFSEKELRDLSIAADLKMSDVVNIDHIGYICTLKKYLDL